MGELKIQQSSLQNAILQDGQFIFGTTETGAEIISSSIGSFAHGYADEGSSIIANGIGSYASGIATEKDGIPGHIKTEYACSYAAGYAKGGDIISNASSAFAYGYVNGTNSYIMAEGVAAYAHGYVNANNSYIYAKGNGAHAEGHVVVTDYCNNPSINAIGDGAHAEGIITKAIEQGAHAEGYYTSALGKYSHTEGGYTETLGEYSHAEGEGTRAKGKASHTEGYQTVVWGKNNTVLFPKPSSFFDQPYINPTETVFYYNYLTLVDLVNLGEPQLLINDKVFDTKMQFGPPSILVIPALTEEDKNWINDEKNNICIISEYSHAEGWITETKSKGSHAEGYCTQTIGKYSHTEGYNTKTLAPYSHASGEGTIADYPGSTAIGQYNKSHKEQASEYVILYIGNGLNDRLRRDALYITSSPSPTDTNNCIVYINGSLEVTTGTYQTSDINLKDVISYDISLDKVYETLEKCHTILYTLKDDESKREQIGMIAQEIKEYFPEIVNELENGTLSLDYSKLSVILFRLCKDLIKKNNEFNERLIKIEEKLNKLYKN